MSIESNLESIAKSLAVIAEHFSPQTKLPLAAAATVVTTVPAAAALHRDHGRRPARRGQRDQLRRSAGMAGGGLVKVRASAKGRIIAVTIDDSLMVPADKQMLEDLVAAAFNDAREKADAASNAEMSKMSSGLPLPPGFKMPF